jgi:antitoxin ParD1/3/4
MPTMNVSLTDDLERFVAEELAEGGYNSQSEVVREGLRLLRSRKEKLRRLRTELDRGLEAVEQGRTEPLTHELLVDIADRASRRANARKSGKG